MSTVDRQLLEALTRGLIDDGFLIEAGWTSYRLTVIPETATLEQVVETRLGFFAGAQHLFASIMTMLEPGAEPTERDVERMTQIQVELERFAAELKRRIH